MKGHARAAVFWSVALGVALLGLGLWWDAWHLLAGGMIALVTAAWLVTEPESGTSAAPGP